LETGFPFHFIGWSKTWSHQGYGYDEATNADEAYYADCPCEPEARDQCFKQKGEDDSTDRAGGRDESGSDCTVVIVPVSDYGKTGRPD